MSSQNIPLPDATVGIPYAYPLITGHNGQFIPPNNVPQDPNDLPFTYTALSGVYSITWLQPGTGTLSWEDPTLDLCPGCLDSKFSGTFVQQVH